MDGGRVGLAEVLDAMEKGTTVEQVEEASGQLRQAGIGVGFFLQFGYPGETQDDIDRTQQLVRRCAPDEIGISVSYPLPGTKFHDRVQEQFGTQRNWVDSDDMAMLYAGRIALRFIVGCTTLCSSNSVATERLPRPSAAITDRPRRPADDCAVSPQPRRTHCVCRSNVGNWNDCGGNRRAGRS